MRIVFSLLVVGLALGSCAGSACAQEPASLSATPSTSRVTLDVVVTAGKRGKPVAGLTQGSFTVLDRGNPVPLQAFRALTGAANPVKILLVVDAVNIGFQQLAYEREQIDRFLQANGGQLPQPTALAVVTDTSTSVEPGFSTDGRKLSAAFDQQIIGLRTLGRGAGFFGAEERLQLSLRAMNQFIARAESEPGRKFIIWMTPGWPLLSGPRVELSSKEQQAIFHEVVTTSDGLRRSRTTLYTVDPLGSAESPARTFYFEPFLKGLQKTSDAYPADLGAQVLSVQSGGLFLSGSNDIASLIQRCFDDASAAYEITFQPAPADVSNEYHKVEVKVAEPNLVARTRQGFYLQP